MTKTKTTAFRVEKHGVGDVDLREPAKIIENGLFFMKKLRWPFGDCNLAWEGVKEKLENKQANMRLPNASRGQLQTPYSAVQRRTTGDPRIPHQNEVTGPSFAAAALKLHGSCKKRARKLLKKTSVGSEQQTSRRQNSQKPTVS